MDLSQSLLKMSGASVATSEVSSRHSDIHRKTLPDKSKIDVYRLWDLAADKPIIDVDLNQLMKEHMLSISKRSGFEEKRLLAADTGYPFIVGVSKRFKDLPGNMDLLDGRHRALKLLAEGITTAKARVVGDKEIDAAMVVGPGGKKLKPESCPSAATPRAKIAMFTNICESGVRMNLADALMKLAQDPPAPPADGDAAWGKELETGRIGKPEESEARQTGPKLWSAPWMRQTAEAGRKAYGLGDKANPEEILRRMAQDSRPGGREHLNVFGMNVPIPFTRGSRMTADFKPLGEPDRRAVGQYLKFREGRATPAPAAGATPAAPAAEAKPATTTRYEPQVIDQNALAVMEKNKLPAKEKPAEPAASAGSAGPVPEPEPWKPVTLSQGYAAPTETPAPAPAAPPPQDPAAFKKQHFWSPRPQQPMQTEDVTSSGRRSQVGY